MTRPIEIANTPAFRQKGIALDIWPDLVLDRDKWDLYTRLTDENLQDTEHGTTHSTDRELAVQDPQ